MASKRRRRTEEFKTRKKKKTFRLFFIFAAVVIGGGFLAFLFWALSDSIFPTDTEQAAKRERKEVVLYFSDANERFLVPEKRYVPKGGNTAAQAEEIVRALIEGPKMGQIRTISAGAKVQEIRIADGTVYLNFDNAFIEQHPGGTASEVATIYSLANTLAQNLPEIKRVRFQVGGRDITTIKGHVDLREPISPNKDLVKQAAAGG